MASTIETKAMVAVSQIRHWIGGKAWEGPVERWGAVMNPATGDQQARVAFASAAVVDAAVAAATKAAIAWRDASLASRTRVLAGGRARGLPAGGIGVGEPRRPPRERVAERHARGRGPPLPRRLATSAPQPPRRRSGGVQLAVDDEPGRLPADRAAGVPGGCGAAAATAPRPGPGGARRGFRGETGGFYALQEASGTVRVFVPGFDFPLDEKAAALPLRRALVEAVVGRRVELGGVRALELQSFRGLVPSALGKAEMQVSRDGTVRAARRGLREIASRGDGGRAAAFPRGELVTLLPSQFQGETKSAVLELQPLRYDSQRRQLDAASLLAQSRQPLLVTMNCLNGYFVAPAFESLAESLVKAEGRGAIAAFAPSGLSLDGPAHQYHRALVAELVSGRHERLGDAVLAAQKAYAQTGLMPELVSVYHLFGDPAARIR